MGPITDSVLAKSYPFLKPSLWASSYMVMDEEKLILHKFIIRIVLKIAYTFSNSCHFLITDPRFVYRQSRSVYEEKKT